jgi:hypothetical protein
MRVDEVKRTRRRRVPLMQGQDFLVGRNPHATAAYRRACSPAPRPPRRVPISHGSVTMPANGVMQRLVPGLWLGVQ